MTRTREQMLGPVYTLITEAQGHLRDAHVGIPGGFTPPKGSDLAWVLEQFIVARERAFTGAFCTAYRANHPVSLADLRGRLEQDVRAAETIFGGDSDICVEPPEIDPDDPTLEWAQRIIMEAENAHRAYACALGVVKTLLGYTYQPEAQVVPPAPESTGPASGGGP